MRFQITHITEYTYSDIVFLEPHYLRFKPRVTAYSVLKDFSVSIEPGPAGISEQIDIDNNHNIFCWFDEMHGHLKITASSSVEIIEYNPFNFLVYPAGYLSIPFVYEKKQRKLLDPELQSEGLSEPMLDFINNILGKTNNHSVNFLAQITGEIHTEFTLNTREWGKPLKPEFTFKQKKGSCRDLAWMQIHMLRQLGIASRFVSGYYYIDRADPEFELHAWVEAYLPGAGWIGLDPSHGILTDHYHVPVASSSNYENTMPVSGSVRGKAKSVLNNKLTITKLD